MPAKKRPGTAKLKEAAPKYTARSRVRDSEAKPKAGTGKALWELLQTLPEEEQTAFAQKLMADRDWYEDICDTIAMRRAKQEPGRPFKEFEAELDAQRRRS